jgi:hypothetical protein
MFSPRHIRREGKNGTIVFITKKIDKHAFPSIHRKCTLSKATFPATNAKVPFVVPIFLLCSGN